MFYKTALNSLVDNKKGKGMETNHIRNLCCFPYYSSKIKLSKSSRLWIKRDKQVFQLSEGPSSF